MRGTVGVVPMLTDRLTEKGYGFIVGDDGAGKWDGFLRNDEAGRRSYGLIGVTWGRGQDETVLMVVSAAGKAKIVEGTLDTLTTGQRAAMRRTLAKLLPHNKARWGAIIPSLYESRSA